MVALTLQDTAFDGSDPYDVSNTVEYAAMAPAAMGKSFASNTHRGLLEAATESVEEVPLAIADPLAAMAPTMASPFASNTHRGLLEASSTVTEVSQCAVSAAPTLAYLCRVSNK